MAIDTTGTFFLLIQGLSDNVFGSIPFTCSFIILFFLIFALLIKIPVPFALAIPIPLAIIFSAYGFMSYGLGGTLAITFMVLAIGSLLAGLGVDR